MEVLISLLLKLAPYLIIGAGILGAYFGIKRKGVHEERTRQEEAQQEAARLRQEALKKAESSDAAIDAKVRDQINAIKKIEQGDTAKPGDKFNF